ncbi:MAG: tryptophan 7-halogenase [Parasphingopyxis sp.]|uniref:NAD(P)/FAD-dependent oxidoreductase n=1 Tax=Parasphingopyxis sp. TaxID=1920299 RepID=UPI0032EAA94E
MTTLSPDGPVDVAIVGGGPAGASLALRLLALGRRPLIVEKEDFPRYHIGESLTGECANLLDELGLGDFMHGAGFPVKRGVMVSGASATARFWVPVEGLAGDGTRFPATTWQVRRDEFDAKLLDTAVERGALHIKGECVDVLREGNRVCGVTIRDSDGATHEVAARAVADCSGQHGFLCRKGVIGPKDRTGYENQVALFAQVKGVRRDPEPNDGSTHIFYGRRHHWAWSIPLDDEVTSVGIVLPKGKLDRNDRSKAEQFAESLSLVNPELIARTQHAEIVSDVHAISNYSYHVRDFTGPGFICVGDSHRFLDPIFSFGVLIALQEAKLAATALNRWLDAPAEMVPLDDYADAVNRAQAVVEYVIRTFWEFPLVFLRLAHFSHRGDIAEIFSGRLYSEKVREIEAVGLMRDLLAKSGKMAA